MVEQGMLCASHFKDKITDSLQRNGSTVVLHEEMFIGFCCDGASVMLETKSEVGKLFKDQFPDVVMWR